MVDGVFPPCKLMGEAMLLKWRGLGAAVLAFAAVVAATNGAYAASLKDEIAPTGKLRVAIATSTAGGAFWCTRMENGYAGVPVDLGKAMAAQVGVPVEYVEYHTSGEITDAGAKGGWDVAFLPKDAERDGKLAFGPVYDIADATYIIRSGSTVTNFATLDQDGTEVAAIEDTTTLRSAKAHLKKAKVTVFKTYDEAFSLLAAGEVDAFALSRDQLNEMAKKLPGTKVLDETFAKTSTAVAVPPKHPQALAFVTKFMTDAKSNGALRKAFDDNGLKDAPLRTQ